MAEKFAAAARSISLCAGLLRRSSKYSIRCDRTSATCLAVARLCTVSSEPRFNGITSYLLRPSLSSKTHSMSLCWQWEHVLLSKSKLHCADGNSQWAIYSHALPQLTRMRPFRHAVQAAVARFRCLAGSWSSSIYLLVYGSHSQGFARTDAELTL